MGFGTEWLLSWSKRMFIRLSVSSAIRLTAGCCQLAVTGYDLLEGWLVSPVATLQTSCRKSVSMTRGYASDLQRLLVSMYTLNMTHDESAWKELLEMEQV